MQNCLFVVVVALAAILSVATAPTLVAQPAQPAQTATLGQEVPNFTLKDHAGNDVTLSALRGKIVVLEWFNPQCPFVRHHYQENTRTMPKLAEKYKDQDVVWMAVHSSSFGSQQFNAQWVRTWNLPYPVLDDRDGRVGRLFGATHTPHMFIIDKTGKLAYVGGIDDNPHGRNPTTTAFVDNALTDLVNGRAVANPRTRAYGCDVKYAR